MLLSAGVSGTAAAPGHSFSGHTGTGGVSRIGRIICGSRPMASTVLDGLLDGQAPSAAKVQASNLYDIDSDPG